MNTPVLLVIIQVLLKGSIYAFPTNSHYKQLSKCAAWHLRLGGTCGEVGARPDQAQAPPLSSTRTLAGHTDVLDMACEL